MRWLLVAFLALAGCATTYQKNGSMTEGGFEDIQLDSNVFQVTFRGNEATSSKSVSEMALLRCGQLALVKGFSYFVIAESNVDQSAYTLYLPATTSATATATAYGNSVYVSGNSTTYGGPITLSSANSKILFVGYRDRPASDKPIFDSKMVCESLAGRYGTACFTTEKAEKIHSEKKVKDAQERSVMAWFALFFGFGCTLIILANS